MTWKQKKKIKCREDSKIYEQNFHSILQSNDNDSDSNDKFSSDVDHGKSNQIFVQQQKYFTQQQKKQMNLPISQNLQHL